jgi:hypothetical protein
MADTVTVTESPGARYTWASAGFTWSSASAGKNWTSAYPAVYGVVAAVTLALAEATHRRGTKRASDGLQLTDMRRLQMTLTKTESVGFAETYTDLIAYVLRWVETMGLSDGQAKANRKAIKETLQASDYLSRAVTKQAFESTALSDALRQIASKQVSESLVMAERAQKLIGKNRAESFGLADGQSRALTKRVAEAIGFAETYADLIAFVLRITEAVGFGELGARQVKKPLSESFATTDKARRQSIKRVAEAVAVGEALGRTVAYRRHLTEGLELSDALRKALRLTTREALNLAEQYRRHANGVISDILLASTEISVEDFLNIVEAGHPPGYTDFRDFIPGDYTYRRALFRAILNSRNSDRGYIEALRLSVDVPDIFDRGTAQITDASAGVTIYFSRSFRVPPEVTMTHKGGTTVAIARLVGAVTTTGFTTVLENTTGTRVTGSFTWIAQGY